MLVQGLVLGFVMSLLLVGCVISIVMLVKNNKKEAQGSYAEAVRNKVEADLPAAEREEMVRRFSGSKVPFRLNDDVFGEATAFYVDWIEVYGKRCASLDEALNCADLTDEEFDMLEEFDASLAILREEKTDERRYVTTRRMLDGEVHVYEPGKFKIDVSSRAGKPARIAIEIVRQKDLTMDIKTVYVSRTDVSDKANRYEYDMLLSEQKDGRKLYPQATSFDLMVRDDKRFADEIHRFEEIERDLNDFNDLVLRGRVKLGANNEVVILPPTPEEIMAKRKEKKVEPIVATTPEEEAIQEVEEEFISSEVLTK